MTLAACDHQAFALEARVGPLEVGGLGALVVVRCAVCGMPFRFDTSFVKTSRDGCELLVRIEPPIAPELLAPAVGRA
jgi:hypothetical protein